MAELSNAFGDLRQKGGLSHADKLIEVNNLLAAFHEENGESLNDVFAEEAAKLRQGILDFRQFVDSPDGLKQRTKVASKLKFADEITVGLDMDTRASVRIAAFNGQIQAASDADKTITTNSTYLESAIPASSLAEPLLATQGREAFPDVFVRTWRYVLLHAPELFYRGGQSDEVVIRDGVDEFFTYLRSQNSPRAVLSANFLPFILGMLSKTSLVDDQGIRIFANTADDITPTDKGAYLHALAQKNAGHALIYIGDGDSDIPALEADDVVACYFALEGSEFEAALKQANIVHFTYRDFHDIRIKLSQLHKDAQIGNSTRRAVLTTYI